MAFALLLLTSQLSFYWHSLQNPKPQHHIEHALISLVDTPPQDPITPIRRVNQAKPKTNTSHTPGDHLHQPRTQQYRDEASPKPHPNARPKMLDINTASHEDLTALRGIGNTYARRILGFRDALGGFGSVEDVGKTYYFPDSVFQKVRPHLVIGTPPRKVPVNKASLKELDAHPFIAPWEAKKIVAYRESVGRLENFTTVLNVLGKNDQNKGHLKPYLSYD